MTTIDKGIPLPTTAAKKRTLSPLAQEIYDTLGGCEVGDSFTVATDYKRAALVGGRMAARLGYAIKTAPEGDAARVWRIEPKVKKVE